jgi:hypothetical protein
MLFLNKLLPIFVLPLGGVFLLPLVALWRRKRWPAFVAEAVLYLSSIEVVSCNLIGCRNWSPSGRKTYGETKAPYPFYAYRGAI